MTMQARCNRSIAVLAMLLFARSAHSDPAGPVRACVSDAQVGAGLNLAQAFAAGGVIRFQCPAGSIVQITRRYVLKVSTLIDGGDAITLDGRGLAGPMLSALQNVTLRHIKVRNFAHKPLPPSAPGQTEAPKTIGRLNGSVVNAFAAVELDHVSIETSDSPIDALGTATVTDSVFLNNRGGLSLHANREVHVQRTRFSGNSHEILMSGGWVRDSSFNSQTSDAVGVDFASGPVEIRHCTFSSIRGGSALSLAQRASHKGSQTITIRDNVFSDNDSGTAPGVITVFDDLQAARAHGQSASVLKAIAALPPALFVLRYNRFTGNRGVRGGAIAADLSHTQGMTSIGDLFVNNSAKGDGGAIMVSGGTLQMSHTLLKGNRAGGRGAALAVAPDGSATLSNALVVSNAGPAGAIAGNAINLVNVTVADNNAVGLLLETRAAQAANVLLARNHPADCLRVPIGVFNGGGMQSDGSCPGIPVGEAFLDAMYVPAAGSPALRAGDPALCRGAVVRGIDLPFQARLNSTSCALGAFEGPPITKFGSKSDHAIAHASPEDNFPDDEGNQPGNSPSNGVSAYGSRANGSPSYSSPGYSSPSYASPPPVSPTVAANSSYGHPPSYEPPPSGAPAPKKSSKKQPTSNRWWSGGRRAEPPPVITPLNTVLAALAAEAAAPVEQVHTFMARGTVMDVYYIDRMGTSRFHLRVNPRQGGPELIVFDGVQWARTGIKAPWHNSPAQDTNGSVPSMANLFRSGLTDAVEQTEPNGGRSVKGGIAWTNGASCAGKLVLQINRAGLPSSLRFDGLCGGKPLQFHQSFIYSGPVKIQPPV